MITFVASWVVAHAGSRWEGASADVAATATVAASADDVREQLLDLGRFATVLPDRCAGSFVVDPASQGRSARVRYDIGPLHRTLDLQVVEGEQGRWVDHDHAGRKGFVTRFVLTPSDGGTTVAVTTYLNAPPWPFKGAFFKRVQPAWEACHADTLAALQTTAESG